MNSDPRLLYIEEVLGVTAGHFRGPVASTHATPAQAGFEAVELLVLTGPLSEAERELLSKILYSVKLPQPVIEENFATTTPAKNILSFAGQGEGRSGAIWSLPKLSEMIGAGADVAAKKKTTWNLLQQLAKEFP